jgi:predicted DNA-binding WGR domain protein
MNARMPDQGDAMIVLHCYEPGSNHDKWYAVRIDQMPTGFQVVGAWGPRGRMIASQPKGTITPHFRTAIRTAETGARKKRAKGYQDVTDPAYHRYMQNLQTEIPRVPSHMTRLLTPMHIWQLIDASRLCQVDGTLHGVGIGEAAAQPARQRSHAAVPAKPGATRRTRTMTLTPTRTPNPRTEGDAS